MEFIIFHGKCNTQICQSILMSEIFFFYCKTNGWHFVTAETVVCSDMHIEEMP